MQWRLRGNAHTTLHYVGGEFLHHISALIILHPQLGDSMWRFRPLFFISIRSFTYVGSIRTRYCTGMIAFY